MRGKSIGFVLATLFLVCLIAFCIGGTVKGEGREPESEQQYRVLEAQLLQDTRDYLNRSGFSNCGVTLTRVVDESENREYTFIIHHAKIDAMSEGEREALAEELAQFNREAGRDFREGTCSFRHEFLIA